MESDILQSIKSLLPKYNTVLPFCGKEVSFTPFRVKDAKNISIIFQENNNKMSLMALVEILKTNSSGVNVMDLCVGDAEYLFLQIRSKSVDEQLNLVKDTEKFRLFIGDIKSRNEIKTETLPLSPEMQIVVETPTLKDFLKIESFDKENLIKCCIKKIIVKNEIYHVNKFVPQEFNEILNNLPLNFMNKFDVFLQSQPELFAVLETKDGPKEVNGFLSFFIFR